MNLTVTAKGVLNLLVRRFMGPFWIRRHWLEKTQWLSTSELEAIQLKLLQDLVRHCYDTVPYYRRLMEKRGFSAIDIRHLDDIKLFPIITKKDVLKAGETIVSTRYSKRLLRTAYTGGTTGTPLVIKRNLFSVGNEHAFVRRQWDWANIRFNDRCAYLTGRLIVKPNQENRKLYAYDPIMRELILSTYHLSRKTAKDFAMVMKKYEVKAVVGYPSAVYLLAKACLDTGIKLQLQSVLTSSETLTEPMRKTIAEAFHCKVFDFYGSAERVCYIHTCGYGKYHVIPEYGLTELILTDDFDDDGYRIISTGFWNKAMPLIRYDTGDIVVKSDDGCGCGRSFPVIKSITGRRADSIKTGSGREFGAAILTHLLYGINNILESQIVQDRVDHIYIDYVPGQLFNEQDFNAFNCLIKQHLPSELHVDFRAVEAVQRTSSGKIRPVMSML